MFALVIGMAHLNLFQNLHIFPFDFSFFRVGKTALTLMFNQVNRIFCPLLIFLPVLFSFGPQEQVGFCILVANILHSSPQNIFWHFTVMLLIDRLFYFWFTY